MAIPAPSTVYYHPSQPYAADPVSTPYVPQHSTATSSAAPMYYPTSSPTYPQHQYSVSYVSPTIPELRRPSPDLPPPQGRSITPPPDMRQQQQQQQPYYHPTVPTPVASHEASGGRPGAMTPSEPSPHWVSGHPPPPLTENDEETTTPMKTTFVIKKQRAGCCGWCNRCCCGSCDRPKGKYSWCNIAGCCDREQKILRRRISWSAECRRREAELPKRSAKCCC